MAAEAQGAQVLPDLDYGPKNMFCSQQNRTGLQLLFYKVFTLLHGWGCRCTPDPVLGPLTPGLGSGLGLGGQDLTKLTIGKAGYNFCLLNFAWKWLTMAPEAHGAQVLSDPDYGPKNMIRSH
jgi:hypothetical protein